MNGHINKNSFYIIFLLATFIFFSCKKDHSITGSNNPTDTTDSFSYTGSQYLGGTLHFTTTALSSSSFTWNFGDSTTATNVAPDHVYAQVGMYVITLVINNDTTHKMSKIIYIGADSLHQALLSGMHKWHVQSEGFYPVTERDTTWHYDDTSIAVYSINPGVILFKGDTLICSSSTDSSAIFSKVHYYDPSIIFSAFAWSSFQYNYNTNQLLYTYTYHSSAEAGNWTDTYTSF